MRTPPTCRKSLRNWITCFIKLDRVHLAWVMIATDCICSYKSNYHYTITTAPVDDICQLKRVKQLYTKLNVSVYSSQQLIMHTLHDWYLHAYIIYIYTIFHSYTALSWHYIKWILIYICNRWLVTTKVSLIIVRYDVCYIQFYWIYNLMESTVIDL